MFFDSFTASLFHSSFVRKAYFTAKILYTHIISMRLTCMSMYAEVHLKPSLTSLVGVELL